MAQMSKSMALPSGAALAATGVCTLLAGRCASGAFSTMPALRGSQPATTPSVVLDEANRPTSTRTAASMPGVRSASTVGGAAVAACLGLRAVSRTVSKKPKQRETLLRRVATLDSAEQATMTGEEAKDQNTMVSKDVVLVLGGTGTLGRQVVRQFIAAGYEVRCLIRDKQDRGFSYLSDWGATLVRGSLFTPETLPQTLIGVHTVVDCATARPEESIMDIDWRGKKAFIQCCVAMKVQRYIFTSIKDCDKFPEVPLMDIKYKTEQFLAQTPLRHTILRITGFMQPLVSQFACAVLDDQPVYGDDGNSPGIAYIDSQDCARFMVAAVTKERTIGKTLTISGPKVWTASDVIELCEELSGNKADVSEVNTLVLKATKALAANLAWSRDIAERLEFVEVNRADASADVMSQEAYDLLGIDPSSTRTLNEYFTEFYRRMIQTVAGTFDEKDEKILEIKEAEEDKLRKAIAKDPKDALPPGASPEVEVSIREQREGAEKMMEYFFLQKVEDSEGDQWFGFTLTAELMNGRSAMMGFSLGLITEYFTEISMTQQVRDLLDIFSGVS